MHDSDCSRLFSLHDEALRTNSPQIHNKTLIASHFHPHDQAYKEKLIGLLKKEVKHIMEESVMLKSIHEDSATVTSLCAVVDTCVSLGKSQLNDKPRLRFDCEIPRRNMFIPHLRNETWTRLNKLRQQSKPMNVQV